MKRLVLFFTLLLSAWAAYSQPGSLSQSVYRSRVNDSTAAIAANVSAIAAGYAPMLYNNQATTPHWDIWQGGTGGSYAHVFDFNSGSGGAGTPGGSTTQVQFNLTGAFAGDADFLFTGGNLLTVPLVKITSGSPGANKVLISDADGDGSWVTLESILGKYVIDQATPSTASGTVTIDMNSQIQRSHVGSASFSAPKTYALSNTTNSLSFQFTFTITDIAAVITVPSDWAFQPSSSWSGTTYTFTSTGVWVFGGDWDGTNWNIKVGGPFSN